MQRLHNDYATVSEGLHNQVCNLQDKVATLHQEIESLRVTQTVMQPVTQESMQPIPTVTQTVMQPPKTFHGWSVQTGKDGYIRLHRKVAGKVLSLHIGRHWDEEKAAKKIEPLTIEGQ